MTEFAFNVEHWFTGTAELSLEEEAAYLRVCCLIYDRRGPIADHDTSIAKKLRISVRRWRKLREALLAHEKIWITPDGCLSNGRAIREIERQSQTMSELAKNRWKKAPNFDEKPEKNARKSPDQPAQAVENIEDQNATALNAMYAHAGDARVEDIISNTSDSVVVVTRAQAREDRQVVAFFKQLRFDHWPHESRLPAPDSTLETQAQQFLNGGAPIALINEVIQRCMESEHARGHPPPTSLMFCHLTMGRAISNHRATRTNGHDRSATSAPARGTSAHSTLIAAGLEAADRRSH